MLVIAATGVDANADVIPVADVRARGYGVADRCRFQLIASGASLRFADAWFDLCATISVLEFITNPRHRRAAIYELARVTRPGGFVYLATPRLWFREYHSRRWLGDFRRAPGHPWSSRASELVELLPGWTRISLADPLTATLARRVPLARSLTDRTPVRQLLPFVVPHVGRRHKLLLQKPS